MIARVDGLALEVRGRRGATPALVIGPGPGFPLLHEVRDLERALGLGDWHAAYLEQRGCGRSRSPGVAPTVPRSIDDVAAAARWLAAEAGAPVIAIGLSLGASYAVEAAARDPAPFRAIVGLGLDVDLPAADVAAHAFVVDHARGDRRALAAAGKFAAPVTTSRALQLRARWLTDLGGMQPGMRWSQAVRRTVFGLLRRYGLLGTVRALRAMNRVQDAMLPELASWNLHHVRALAVPLALVHGARDAVSPPGLVRAWIEALDAPSASLRVVDDAGHLPYLERPEVVREVLGSARAGTS